MVPTKERNIKIVAVIIPKVPNYVVEAVRLRVRAEVKVNPLNLRKRKEDEGRSMDIQKARVNHFLVTIIEQAGDAQTYRLSSPACQKKLVLSPESRHSSGIVLKNSV